MSDAESKPVYLTSDEVAARYRCTRQVVRLRAKAGQLPCRKFGRRILFPVIELDRLDAAAQIVATKPTSPLPSRRPKKTPTRKKTAKKRKTPRKLHAKREKAIAAFNAAREATT
jgi:hypothetical protein